MARHVAPDELLLDYASGALAEGPALAVALHAALDPAARKAIDRLTTLGAALLEGESAAAVDDAQLAKAMSRIEGLAVEPKSEAAPLPEPFGWAPKPLHRYLHGDMRWQPKFGGFDEMTLNGIRGHRVSLLRLTPGRGLPMHRHTGDEFTVVLQGGYSDGTGHYGPGDFAVGPEGEHKPVADAGDPCIALIVLENPIVLTGAAGRLLNPLIKRGII